MQCRCDVYEFKERIVKAFYNVLHMQWHLVLSVSVHMLFGVASEMVVGVVLSMQYAACPHTVVASVTEQSDPSLRQWLFSASIPESKHLKQALPPGHARH